MNALLDPVDQRELPGPPFDLPDAETDQADDGSEQQHREPQGRRTRCRSRAARSPDLASHRPKGGHGILLISWTGIMLVVRWCMTHSDPDSAITTMTMVKISAIMLQPFSDVVFMCSK